MNRFYQLILCFALLALTACSENLFGSPGNSNCGTDIKCLQMDAENAFRSNDYRRAYSIYSQIVSLDSTVSAGYFGMAKASLWMSDVNPFEVFVHVKKGEGEIAFMDEIPADQNRFFQGMKRAGPALRELERRDTLTALYEFYKRGLGGFDSMFTVIIKEEDEPDRTESWPLEKRVKEFKSEYCNTPTGDCFDKNNKHFPLSDRVFRYNAYNGGMVITTVSEKILNIMDTNKDGCIAKKCPKEVEEQGGCGTYNTNFQKWKEWGCSTTLDGKNYRFDLTINLALNEDGNFEINFNQILDEMDLEDFYADLEKNRDAELPEDVLYLNEKMNEFNGDMSDIADMMDKFKTNMGTEEVPFNWEADIGAYKDYSTFYKIGTNIDEDGDGCIGEDILDGRDNDGDGLKNGNARLVPIDWNNPQKFSLDGVDNSMAGVSSWNLPKKYHKDDDNFKHICRDKALTDCFRPEPDEEDSITVINFTQEMSGYWTSNNLELKLAVARDTVCGQLNYSLQDRVNLIGGCWPNYDEDKFIKYWLKREYARPDDREKRVHAYCKSCEGSACTKTKPKK